ncbi:hypothetical protein KIW84_042751 [Lathyrus oleraceus]|uniref:Putative plant transposon protein domain-containing protein n=1 Tax=Pisum sativum TaxID=3888 RepID=A0A9D4XBR6_PEA|nr:hypothetical protein KIW84_042751 [Pisum sativum]
MKQFCKQFIFNSSSSTMDAQQQQVFNFSQQMESSTTAQSSSIPTPTVTGVSITLVYKEPHVLDREPHINLATPFEGLEVLCESLVDFNNMKRNGVDLTEELHQQGWENYFQRLYGPVYPNLIKEFWRFVDADDHFIVSYVLGVKIVITEKSIASLLNMEKTGGRRIYDINPRSRYIAQVINPTIFKLNTEGNPSKNKELHQNLRVWLKIILGTIHHRPASNSSDYINTDQKCILYCIHKGLKLCLPALLFRYLRDSVRETRNNMKPRTYIPLGRLLSDVFIENGLVDHLEKNKLMEDLAIDTRRPLNSRNLKSMGILKKIQFKPTLDTSWDALKDQRKLSHGLARFYKNEPREAILHYMQRLKDEGVDISNFRLDDCLDSEEDFVRFKRGPSKKKSSKAKKARLGETSETRSPAPLQVSTGKSAPSIPSEPHVASSNPLPAPIYTTSETPPSTTRTSQPLPKFNPAHTSLPLSEVEELNQTTSSSSNPDSPPYLILSSDPEPSDPASPTLAHLYSLNQNSQQPQQPPPEPEVTSPPPEQTTNNPSEAQPSDITPQNTSAEPEPLTLNLNPPNSPPQTSEPEPEHSMPTLEEAIMLFAGASVQKVKSLTINSGISDDPDSHISEQVRNDFIRDAEARLQEKLAREAEKEARRQEEERVRQAEIQRAKEAEAKALADAAAAAEAEAQAAAEAEAKAAAEAQSALTQGESSTVVPMVLQTLEELKKDQKELRARMDKQDTVNDNIQNMLAQLLQRMPLPPNP